MAAFHTLLKNVYSFLDALQQAHTDQVAAWDLSALKNALQWARYAQQICNHAQGKSYEEELKRNIERMSSLPWSLGNRQVGIQLLRTARHEMKMILLQNRHLPESLFDQLLLEEFSIEEVPDQACVLFQQYKCVAEITNILNQYGQLTLPGDSVRSSLPTDVFLAYASLILTHIQTVLNSSISKEKRDSTEVMLQKKFHRIIDSKLGNDIVMSCLVYNKPGVSHPTPQQEFVMSVILNCVKNNPSRAKLLWDSSHKFLTKACAWYSEICDAYNLYLHESADSLEPTYPQRKPGCALPQVQWIQTHDNGLEFDDLVERYKVLCNTSSYMKRTVIDKLKENAKSSEYNVWRTILKNLEIKFS